MRAHRHGSPVTGASLLYFHGQFIHHTGLTPVTLSYIAIGWADHRPVERMAGGAVVRFYQSLPRCSARALLICGAAFPAQQTT